MQSKNREQSFTTMTQLVLQSHINGAGRLFGGQLMSWMDVVGAICAKRHAEYDVVTASAKNLEFFEPAMPNDIVNLTAILMSVGKTSMKIKVMANVEPYDHGRRPHKRICEAEFTYIAMDEEGKKHVVPPISGEDRGHT